MRRLGIGVAATALGPLLLGAPAAAQAGGAAFTSATTGGAEYNTALIEAAPPRPVARAFAVSPHTVEAPALPRVSLRVDQPSARTVRARLVFLPSDATAAPVRVDLGRVPAGRRITVSLPSSTVLPADRYVVRLHVRGRRNSVLARSARTPGRTTLVVTARPAPQASASGYVFPVAGAWSFGGEDAKFGAARKGHSHEGQDITAAEGTPVVAPTAGTVRYTEEQPGGAGFYVVLDGADGRSYFFAHCVEGSFAVRPGAAVIAGQQLCQVGRTGQASGPHLHFEIWLGGWRVDSASHPIDPLPELRTWAA